MSLIEKALSSCFEYKELAAALDSGRLPVGFLGLSHIHKVHFIHSACVHTSRKAMVITPDESTAVKMCEDLKAFGTKAAVLPAAEYYYRPNHSHSHDYDRQRIAVLSGISEGKFDVVIASVEAAMQLTIPPVILRRNTMYFDMDSEILPDMIADDLISAGYSRYEMVQGKGQFAIRGNIIDIFPPAYENPVRIELWGESINSIASFETDSQRRTDTLTEVTITPAASVLFEDNRSLIKLIENHKRTLKGKGSAKIVQSLDDDIDKLNKGIHIESLDRYIPLLYGTESTVFDYVSDYMLFVCETSSVKSRAESSQKLTTEEVKGLIEEGILCKGMDTFAISFEKLTQIYSKLRAVYLDNLPRGSFDTPVKDLLTLNARQLSPWTGQLQDLIDDVLPALNKKYKVLIYAGTDKAAMSLREDLNEENVNAVYCPVPPAEILEGSVIILPGSPSFGFDYTGAKFMGITHGARHARTVKTSRSQTKKPNGFNSLEEMHKGDYVVHSVHGIGIFDGIVTLNPGGITKDYIKIRYAKDGVLYVPVSQLDLVSKYIGPGADTGHVKINKMGTTDWQKTKSRVRAAVKDMAKELTQLYKKRMEIKGYAFGPDDDLLNNFESRFEFEETPDQLRCIAEIKGDMERPYPMDRLLCGDVGFGKTEVALRAAFKCVTNGKQCAILVPTTILAMQHYQTIKKRIDAFPVNCDMISRYRTQAEQTEMLKKLKNGTIDIIVGTHILLSENVKFSDLGLVIIDEEQRFGVAQKEKLKSLYPQVDILTLSATPIPRTLNMAMTGIRDMSLIEEAPQDRQPVQTYVIEHDMGIIVQAIEREIRRGGQVYYLHNSVEDINHCADLLRKAMPDIRIGIGHGKMNEKELSGVWQKLLEAEIDVLVCTTIIETGVDVPNVNTLIVENADRMGLSQLHQIRGRVGRSPRRASAYFTFRPDKALSETATRRLEAIREFTEFGSGIKIATRDLELRGAGNILGAQQHGHMDSVGYDMYVDMLSEAVSEEKGEEKSQRAKECVIDVKVDAYIPETYIRDTRQKLAIYKRIADIHSEDDASDVWDELTDRFGDPPECVQGLIDVALLRNSAADIGVQKVSQRGDMLIIYIKGVDIKRVIGLASQKGRQTEISEIDEPYIAVRRKKGESPLAVLREAISIMRKVEL